MAYSRTVMIGAAALAAVIAVPMVALASHGKAGLWSVTVTVHMSGMPQIPPAERAKMKQMGIKIPGSDNTLTTKHCMTEAEVKADSFKAMQRRNKHCKVTNQKIEGQRMTADMVCTGEMQGQGHIAVTYHNAEHYTGRMTFTGTTHGHQTNVTDTFEGHWLSADCGNVHN